MRLEWNNIVSKGFPKSKRGRILLVMRILVIFGLIRSTSFYLVLFGPIQSTLSPVHFGSFGLIWSTAVQFGPIQSTLVLLGQLCSTLSTSVLFGPRQSVWFYSVLFRPLWSYLVLFDYFGLIRSILVHSV